MRDLGILLAPGAFDGVPAVAGRWGGVKDQDRTRAMAGCFFVFVGPAPIIGERLASKEFRIVGGWFIREEHDYLALHVDALIVVPVKFGGHNAVADENGISVDAFVRGLQLVRAYE